MRIMPIRIVTGKGGLVQLKASFRKNYRHYLQEALGLGIFMISACFFGALLEASHSPVHQAISSGYSRLVIMGILMGLTALFIFYSPWTSPSGSHINPAVTLCFLRLDKMCPWDALFFILFQFIGGTGAVYSMQWLMGDMLTDPPVSSVVTVPGKPGIGPAFIMEAGIAFVMMLMVLFTSVHKKFSRYTRIIAGCLVCLYVIIAGPVSGFGMNPARTFASSLPAGIWTAFWLYMIVPVLSMLLAVELFLLIQKRKNKLSVTAAPGTLYHESNFKTGI